jgi:predicted N-acetyltransferase YhbS
LTLKLEKLQQDHPVGAFDCGKEPLNRFLHKFAWMNQASGSATTYVALADQTVVGYYSIAAGSAETERVPSRIKKGLGDYPIPVALLARLAVDQNWQRRGVGTGLLKDAMLRTLRVADQFGVRAVLVHAKDEDAKRFYMRFDFVPSPTDALHLYILIKDIRHIVQ